MDRPFLPLGVYGSASSSQSTGSACYKWILTSLTTLNPGSIWELGLAETGYHVHSGYYLEFGVAVTTNLPPTPFLSLLPTASAINYGQTLASSTLSGGAVTNPAGAPVAGTFAFSSPSTTPGLGITTESAIFTPSDTMDYYALTTSVPVTVVNGGPMEMTFISSLPTASAVSLGQTLATSTLSGGAATNAAGVPVAGSFAFTVPSTVPALGVDSEAVTFIPVDTNGYYVAAASVPVTVIPFTYNLNPDGVGLSIVGYTGSGGTVTIPDTINGQPVTSIGELAFRGCSTLTSITMGANINTIGGGAFNVCGSLTNIVFGNSVTNIAEGAFAECGNLANVTIPDSVTSIGENAFDGCASLTTVTLGCGVTNIAIQAFAGFNHLLSITVATNNPVFSSLGGVLFDQKQTVLLQYPGALSGRD